MQSLFRHVSTERILGGTFAKEFTALDGADGTGIGKKLDELYGEAAKSELAVGEKKVRDRLGLRTI